LTASGPPLKPYLLARNSPVRHLRLPYHLIVRVTSCCLIKGTFYVTSQVVTMKGLVSPSAIGKRVSLIHENANKLIPSNICLAKHLQLLHVDHAFAYNSLSWRSGPGGGIGLSFMSILFACMRIKIPTHASINAFFT